MLRIRTLFCSIEKARSNCLTFSSISAEIVLCRALSSCPACWPVAARVGTGEGETYRVKLSRLASGFSVRTWEIKQGKSHKNRESNTAYRRHRHGRAACAIRRWRQGRRSGGAAHRIGGGRPDALRQRLAMWRWAGPYGLGGARGRCCRGVSVGAAARWAPDLPRAGSLLHPCPARRLWPCAYRMGMAAVALALSPTIRPDMLWGLLGPVI
eukprot:SAG31_NODE_1238_length_9176_cov_9.589181_9_plen_211_part_00